MCAPMTWLRKLTTDQWAALVRDYPVRTGTPGEQAAVLGVFLVSALVLTVSEYGVSDLHRFFPVDLATGSAEWRYWRKMGWVLGVAACYLIPTSLYAWLVLGLSPRDLGLNTRGFLRHAPLYIGLFAIVFPLVVVFSADEHFLRTYPLCRIASRHWEWLLGWEIAYAVQFVGVEFFFRGFMLFGAVRLLGPWVLPAMVVPYCMLHFAKPWPETLGAIVAGTVLGVVALRTRSILAGICIHSAVAWSMDLAALYRNGELSRLMEGG